MSDLSIIILYSVILFVSITLNISLLILIVLATPKSNKNYSIFMIAHTVFDIIITMSTFSNMSRILVLSSHLVWIMHGPCGLLSTRMCYLAFDGYLTGVSAVFWINMVSFIARLIILRRGFISRKRVLLLLLLFVAPHVIALSIFFSFGQIPDEEARQLVVDNVPQYSHETTIVASSNILSVPIAYTLCYTCVLIYPAMMGIWILRSKTVVELDVKGKQMSQQTRMLHQTFVKVLTYQAMVPAIFVLSATLFMVVQLLEWRQPAAESVPMMIGETPAILSALINLTYISAYRRYLYRLIFRREEPAYDRDQVSSHSSSIELEMMDTARSAPRDTTRTTPRGGFFCSSRYLALPQ